jgi:hypothetical protein
VGAGDSRYEVHCELQSSLETLTPDQIERGAASDGKYRCRHSTAPRSDFTAGRHCIALFSETDDHADERHGRLWHLFLHTPTGLLFPSPFLSV